MPGNFRYCGPLAGAGAAARSRLRVGLRNACAVARQRQHAADDGADRRQTRTAQKSAPAGVEFVAVSRIAPCFPRHDVSPLLPAPGLSWPGFPSETQLGRVFAFCGRAARPAGPPLGRPAFRSARPPVAGQPPRLRKVRSHHIVFISLIGDQKSVEPILVNHAGDKVDGPAVFGFDSARRFRRHAPAMVQARRNTSRPFLPTGASVEHRGPDFQRRTISQWAQPSNRP